MGRPIHSLARIVVLAIGCGGLASRAPLAADAPKPPRARPPFELRLTTLKEGLDGYLDRPKGKEIDAVKAARAVGIDLANPPHPLVAHRFVDGQLFYVFCKTTENAFGDRAYLIQRVKKTERTWPKPDSTSPEERVTYLVEAFKSIGGVLKGEDQHFGHFHLNGASRREVIKEYEIGFGEVPTVCEGAAWPYAPGSLYQRIQGYQEEIGLYAKTTFGIARTWSLVVSLAASGAHRVASEALGFDLPSKPLDPAIATPPRDPTSADVVLETGVGTLGVRVGVSTADEVIRALGTPLEDVPAGRDHRLLSFGRSITCNIAPDGLLKTILTRPGFAGKSKDGVAHGLSRAEVKAILGEPASGASDAEAWTFDGIVVRFDGFDRVSRLVVTKRKP